MVRLVGGDGNRFLCNYAKKVHGSVPHFLTSKSLLHYYSIPPIEVMQICTKKIHTPPPVMLGDTDIDT